MMSSNSANTAFSIAGTVDAPIHRSHTNGDADLEGVVVTVPNFEDLKTLLPEGCTVDVGESQPPSSGQDGSTGSRSGTEATDLQSTMYVTQTIKRVGSEVALPFTIASRQETPKKFQKKTHSGVETCASVKHSAKLSWNSELPQKLVATSESMVQQQSNGTTQRNLEHHGENEDDSLKVYSQPLAFRADETWWHKLTTKEKVEVELALIPQTPLSLYHRIHPPQSAKRPSKNPPASFLSLIKPLCRKKTQMTDKAREKFPDYFRRKHCVLTDAHMELLPSVWQQIREYFWKIALSKDEKCFIEFMKEQCWKKASSPLKESLATAPSVPTSRNPAPSAVAKDPAVVTATAAKSQKSCISTKPTGSSGSNVKPQNVNVSTKLLDAIEHHLAELPNLPSSAAGSALMEKNTLKGIREFDTYTTVPIRRPRSEVEFRELIRKYNQASEMYGQLRRATEKLCDRYERIKTWKTSLHKLVENFPTPSALAGLSEREKHVMSRMKSHMQRINRFLKDADADLNWCSQKLSELFVFHRQLQAIFDTTPHDALGLELKGMQ